MIAAIGLALYRWAWIAAWPALRLASSVRALPRNWRVTERLDPGSPWPPEARPIWMHCASLGEAKGLWALARGLPAATPLLFTAATSAGADYLARECAASGAARRARLAPLDHPGLIGRFLEQGRLRGLCLYEAELWPNALAACARRGLPAALVAGRMAPEASKAFHRIGGAGSRLLASLAWIEAQSAGDRSRFASLTAVPVHAGADYKALAYLAAGASGPREPRARDGLAFVSLHLPELRGLLPALPGLAARHAVRVFPRHAGEMDAFAAVLEPLGFARASRRPDARHLLVDGFGQVGGLLPDCHTAFVGGSLVPRGCHNLWEPLAAGCRILFGPDFRHQRALAERLMARGLAHAVPDARSLPEMAFPDARQAAACAAAARECREEAEAAARACRERILATFARAG